MKFSREFFINLLYEKGDSLIVSVHQDLLKVHIHTDEAQNLLDEFSAYGDYVETKVDDMLMQQELNQFGSHQRKHEGYIILSFAHGDGIIKTFSDLGCDIVFTAPQNYHINAEHFHLFIEKFIHEEIILLPNDESIYHTALSFYPSSQYPKVHIVDSPNIITSYFLLSLMIGTDSVENVMKTFLSYKQSDFFIVKILSITIQQKEYYVGFAADETAIYKTLGDTLRGIANYGKIAPCASIVVFRGQTVREEEAQEVVAFFSNDEERDCVMLDGKQGDFDFIIGAI